MAVQLLVSCVNADIPALIRKMQIQSSAVIVDQCDRDGEETIHTPTGEVRVWYRKERGVGASRNLALEKACQEICIFSDEDIVYEAEYVTRIEKEFAAHPEADGLLFQVEVDPSRKTYQNDSFGPVTKWNCGRYPAYSMAFRTEKLHACGAKFSLLFGGGAPYSNGEDSLFLKEFMDKGYRVYTAPVTIGHEEAGDSTWFEGYHEKFFHDRGVLYRFLYGRWKSVMALRFLLAHRDKLCRDVSVKQAYGWMKDGMKESRNICA